MKAFKYLASPINFYLYKLDKLSGFYKLFFPCKGKEGFTYNELLKDGFFPVRKRDVETLKKRTVQRHKTLLKKTNIDDDGTKDIFIINNIIL